MKKIAPEPGAAIGEETIFEVELEYAVPAFRRRSTYRIVPQFGDNRGPGHTFNAASDLTVLREPKGEVQLVYPVSREFGDPRLAHPIQLWLYLLDERRDGSARVIAKVGPFTYQ